MRIIALLATCALFLSTVFAEDSIKHHYTTVNGLKLHYVKSGNGPVILFLHGFPEFWYEWAGLIPLFATDHTVIAPDMRGYNLSEKPTDLSQYVMPKLVEDIR